MSFLLFRAPSIVPAVWAQREDKLYLTFKNTSCKDWKVDFEKNKVIFTGTSGNVSYENTLELFDEIITTPISEGSSLKEVI